MPRLPEIFDRSQLPQDKREIYDYLLKARGKVSNGYAPMLHSPELVGRMAHLGTYVRFESSLPKKILELLAFTTAAELDDRYEQANHALASSKLGVNSDIIDAVNNRLEIKGASDDEALAIQCARELTRQRQLSDSTFWAAHKLLGDQGVVELVGTISYYAMLAYAHNAMQVRMNPT